MKANSKKSVSKNTMILIYSIVIAFCVAILVVLLTLTIISINRNKELKAQEAQVVEHYNELAQKEENLADPDYAEVYFDGNIIYIPSEDVVIEYQP